MKLIEKKRTQDKSKKKENETKQKKTDTTQIQISVCSFTIQTLKMNIILRVYIFNPLLL